MSDACASVCKRETAVKVLDSTFVLETSYYCIIDGSPVHSEIKRGPSHASSRDCIASADGSLATQENNWLYQSVPYFSMVTRLVFIFAYMVDESSVCKVGKRRGAWSTCIWLAAQDA